MQDRLLQLLRCPRCQGTLSLSGEQRAADGSIESGELACAKGCRYPVERGIPRFVPKANYADNFGLQWKKFGRVQLDSAAGNEISRTRFLATTGWTREDTQGALVLDGGCGAGRFAEIALSLGAEVVAMDYSAAIDACKENLGSHGQQVHFVQADLLALPFAPRSFDAAYSMGVLQHTPDPLACLRQLTAAVKPGGRVVGDIYEQGKLRYLNSIYWYRPLLRLLPPQLLLPAVERGVRLLHPLKSRLMKAFQGHPIPTVLTSMLLPINAHHHQFPFLSEQQALDWAVLNTFDAYSPHYDSPQTPAGLEKWGRELGLVEAKVFTDPGKGDGTALVIRGRAPQAQA
jgi:SAM-dependent methyltransferase